MNSKYVSRMKKYNWEALEMTMTNYKHSKEIFPSWNQYKNTNVNKHFNLSFDYWS